MVRKVIPFIFVLLFITNLYFVRACGPIGECSGCPDGQICTGRYNNTLRKLEGICTDDVDNYCEELEKKAEEEKENAVSDDTCPLQYANKSLCGAAGKCPTGYECIRYGGSASAFCMINLKKCPAPESDDPAYDLYNKDKKLYDKAWREAIAGKNLIYSGPKITNLIQIITPISKALYYGGIFIGFCFIVYAGYILMTSEGNPERTKEGQEQLTAAILGIMFILLSAAILRVIINSLIGGSISI